MIDFVNANGLGVIGTPEMLVELMQKWQTQSGGFGTCMLLHHEFANPEATVRSHELLARLVMPEFQGKADAIRAAEARAAAVRAGEPGPASQLQVVPFLMPSVADGCARNRRSGSMTIRVALDEDRRAWRCALRVRQMTVGRMINKSGATGALVHQRHHHWRSQA